MKNIIISLLTILIGFLLYYIYTQHKEAPTEGFWADLAIMEVIIQFCVPILHKKKLKI